MYMCECTCVHVSLHMSESVCLCTYLNVYVLVCYHWSIIKYSPNLLFFSCCRLLNVHETGSVEMNVSLLFPDTVGLANVLVTSSDFRVSMHICQM